MSSNNSDIAAAWIVALALVAAMAAHAFLPETPPRLGHGVSGAEAARVGANFSGGSVAPDSDVPLIEIGRSLNLDDVSASVPVAGPAVADPAE